MNVEELESQRIKMIDNLINQLHSYVNNSDLVTNAIDPELGLVFYSQSITRIHTCDETIPTAEEAQTWLDQIASSQDFRRKYKYLVRMVIRQQDTGKQWPAAWRCEHERGTDVVFVTFCPGELHRGAILYELAQILRMERSPGLSARHDREFRQIFLDLASTYGTDLQKRWLKQVFKALKLPFTAVRRRQYDGIT